MKMDAFMNYCLLRIHDLLSLIKTYYFVIPILVCGFATYYSMSIRSAASSDIRNSGTGLPETVRLANLIFIERRLKRDWQTIVYCYGLPPAIVLWIVAMFLG
jgi:hypothetical protein